MVAVVLGTYGIYVVFMTFMGASRLGLSFLGLQTLANFGYINVDHTQISNDFNKVLDRNNDGKVDQEDAAIVYEQTVNALQLNIPAGGGFAAGFLGGLRSG